MEAEVNCKWQNETFYGVRHVLILDYGDGFITINLLRITGLYTDNRCMLWCINYTSSKLLKFFKWYWSKLTKLFSWPTAGSWYIVGNIAFLYSKQTPLGPGTNPWKLAPLLALTGTRTSILFPILCPDLPQTWAYILLLTQVADRGGFSLLYSFLSSPQRPSSPVIFPQSCPFSPLVLVQATIISCLDYWNSPYLLAYCLLHNLPTLQQTGLSKSIVFSC